MSQSRKKVEQCVVPPHLLVLCPRIFQPTEESSVDCKAKVQELLKQPAEVLKKLVTGASKAEDLLSLLLDLLPFNISSAALVVAIGKLLSMEQYKSLFPPILDKKLQSAWTHVTDSCGKGSSAEASTSNDCEKKEWISRIESLQLQTVLLTNPVFCSLARSHLDSLVVYFVNAFESLGGQERIDRVLVEKLFDNFIAFLKLVSLEPILEASLRQLYDALVRLLKKIDFYVFNLGVAYATLLTLVPSSTFSDSGSDRTILAAISTLFDSSILTGNLRHFAATVQYSILRGILITVPLEILSSLQSEQADIQPLLLVILDYAQSQCACPLIEYEKFLAFQVLSLCLQKYRQLIQKNLLKLSQSEFRSCFEKVLALVKENWVDQIEVAGNVFEELVKLLDCCEMIWKDQIKIEYLGDLFNSLIALNWSFKPKYVILQVLLKHPAIVRIIQNSNTLDLSRHFTIGLSLGKCAQKPFLTWMEVIKKAEKLDASRYFESHVTPCLVPLLFSPEHSQSTLQFSLPFLMKLFLKNNVNSLVDKALKFENESQTGTIPLRNLNISVQILSFCNLKQTDSEFIHLNFRDQISQAIACDDKELCTRALLLVFGPTKLTTISEYQLGELKSFIVHNAKGDWNTKMKECLEYVLKRVGEILATPDCSGELVNYLDQLVTSLFSSLTRHSSRYRIHVSLQILKLISSEFSTHSHKLDSDDSPKGRICRLFDSPFAFKQLLEALTHSEHKADRDLAADLLAHSSFSFGLDSAEPDLPSDAMLFLRSLFTHYLKSNIEKKSEVAVALLKIIFQRCLSTRNLLFCNSQDDSLVMTSHISGDELFNQTSFLDSLQRLLTRHMDVFRTNPLQASLQFPLFGILATLRNCLSVLPLEKLCVPTESNMLYEFVPAVIDVLMSISKEVLVYSHAITYKYLRPEGKPYEELFQGNGKSVMSNCWRTLVEISLIFSLVTSKKVLSVAKAVEIGALLIHLLLHSIHTGVINGLSASFEAICLHLLLQSQTHNVTTWLKYLLKSTEQFDDILNTRRSAGLPHCITAILRAELKMNMKSLYLLTMNFALQSIQAISTATNSKGISHTQLQSAIHALNILRSVLLDKHIEFNPVLYLESLTLLLFRCLKNEDWSIRNSATLTLCVLLESGYHINTNATDSALSTQYSIAKIYKEMPLVFQYILQELSSGQGDVHQYLLLVFLGNLQPLMASNAKEESLQMSQDLQKLKSTLKQLALIPAWSARALASKALVAMLTFEESESFLSEMTSELNTGSRNVDSKKLNYFHGLLLLTKEIFIGYEKHATISFCFKPQVALGLGRIVIELATQLSRRLIDAINLELVAILILTKKYLLLNSDSILDLFSLFTSTHELAGVRNPFAPLLIEKSFELLLGIDNLKIPLHLFSPLLCHEDIDTRLKSYAFFQRHLASFQANDFVHYLLCRVGLIDTEKNSFELEPADCIVEQISSILVSLTKQIVTPIRLPAEAATNFLMKLATTECISESSIIMRLNFLTLLYKISEHESNDAPLFTSLLELIEANYDDDCTFQLRLCFASSLVIAFDPSQSLRPFPFRFWKLVLELLQDDSEEIRAVMNRFVAQLVSATTLSSSSGETLLSQFYSYLTQTYHDSPDYLPFLFSLLEFNTDARNEGSEAATLHFEIEKANEWKEELAFVQLTCREIALLLDPSNVGPYFEAFSRAAMKQILAYSELSQRFHDGQNLLVPVSLQESRNLYLLFYQIEMFLAILPSSDQLAENLPTIEDIIQKIHSFLWVPLLDPTLSRFITRWNLQKQGEHQNFNNLMNSFL